MKKLSTLILTLIIAASAAAQVKMDMVLNPTPPANLGEWGNRREVMTVIISPGPAGGQFQFKIKVEITASDGTVAGTNDLVRAPIFALQTTPQIFTAADVMPLENMIFTGKYKSSLDRTGKLPSDNYTLCLTPVRPVDLTPMAPPVCKPFFLAATQLPTLMKPYDAEVLDGKKAQTAIIFRWTPVIPRQTDPVTYRIQVFEIREFQTPMQALRANQPLLDQQVMGVTQYIWRPQMDFAPVFQENSNQGEMPHDPHKTIVNTGNPGSQKNINTSEAGLGSGKDNKISLMPRFIWTIQTLDSHGDPITRTDGNGEARSEPIMFFVDPNPKNSSSKEKKGHVKDIKDSTGNGGG